MIKKILSPLENEHSFLGGINSCILVYTDGSSNWRDLTGGIGIYMECETLKKQISKGFNNIKTGQAELTALLFALRALNKNFINITIYCDSQYAVYSITRWSQAIYKKNQELISAIRNELKLFKTEPHFQWIKGHSKIKGNEIADKLATEGRKSPNKECFLEFIKTL